MKNSSSTKPVSSTCYLPKQEWKFICIHTLCLYFHDIFLFWFKICERILKVPEHFLPVPVRWRSPRLCLLKSIHAVWIPGRPWNGCPSTDSTLIQWRQWRESEYPSLHVLHSEGKELLLQKLGAGHYQNKVSHSLKFLYSFSLFNIEKILLLWTDINVIWPLSLHVTSFIIHPETVRRWACHQSVVNWIGRWFLHWVCRSLCWIMSSFVIKKNLTGHSAREKHSKTSLTPSSLQPSKANSFLHICFC